MMKTKISPRDIELLSAYLDGELDPRKQAQLETRLRTSPDLSAALEDLRRTRILLRSVKPLKAPRSFKLKPEMVSQRSTRPIYPVFQFASAIAGILFVVVLLGDLLGLSPRPSARTAYAPLVSTQAALMAPANPQQESPKQTENPAAPSGPALKSNAIQETETPAFNAEAVEAATSQASAGAAAPAAAPTPEGTQMGIMAEPNVYSNTLPMIRNDTTISPEITTQATAQSAREGLPAEFPYLRVAEVALGLLAVSAGLVGFYLKRGNG